MTKTVNQKRIAAAKRNGQVGKRQLPKGNTSTARTAHLMGAEGSAVQQVTGAGKWKGKPMRHDGAELVYRALGSTTAGREWALIALHPCGEFVTTAEGIPDETQASVVTPCYRGQGVIAWDATLFEVPPDPSGDFQYDVQIFMPPTVEIQYIYRLNYQGTWSRWITVYQPLCLPLVGGGGNTMSVGGASNYRLMGRGTTVYLIAPDLANQGQIIAGQIQPVKRDVNIDYAALKTGAGAPGFEEMNGTAFYIPTDESELVAQDERCAQWPAKLGTYTPQRFSQPTQLFQPTGDSRAGKAPDRTSTTLGAAPTTGLWLMKNPLVGLDAANMYPMRVQGVTPTWDASSNPMVDPVLMAWGVSPPGNVLSGVQFFKGIANVATLQVKTRVYVEQQVLGIGSQLSLFTHRAPMLDRPALDLVTKVGQAQQHVFLASDNDLSGILTSVGKILSGIITPVAAIAEGSGIPIVSDIGKTVGGLSKRFSRLFD